MPKVHMRRKWRFIGSLPSLLEISEEERKAFKPSPTAYSYTSHMYRSVLSGNFAEILAALLPCYWLYYEVGEKLLHCDPGHPIYQKWIGTYGGDWFRQQVEEQINRFNEPGGKQHGGSACQDEREFCHLQLL